MSEIKHRIAVFVRIDECCGSPKWRFESEHEGVHPDTGKVTLTHFGETEITYLLYGLKYKLLFINMDAARCAARQIHTIHVDTKLNAITIIDSNDGPYVGRNPICLRLIARLGNDIHTAIISPDPEVENNPNSHA